MGIRKTASYKIISGDDGDRCQFLCDLSGAVGFTTKPLKNPSSAAELAQVWDTEGRRHFNLCHRCGKWCIDEMYNVEVLECVECAPYEDTPRYCKYCGVKIDVPMRKCPDCGKKLIYEGGDTPNDIESEISSA